MVPLSAFEQPWETLIEQGVRQYVQEFGESLHVGHTQDTPRRVVSAMTQQVRGQSKNPARWLTVAFDEQLYNEMIHVSRIRIISTCAHHLMPIIGRAHFAYIPDRKVVGLSKIPRFIRDLAARLQVQENLTAEVVDQFCDAVKPKGCAVYIAALHCCMSARGAEEHDALTVTTACRGVFLDHPSTKQEFLSAAEVHRIQL